MYALILLSCAIAATQAQYPNYQGVPPAGPAYHHQPAALSSPPSAPIGHDGTVVDTPEVAEAKAAHFAEFARAAARASEDNRGPPVEEGPGYNPEAFSRPNYGYSAAPAPAPAGPIFSRPSYAPQQIQYQPQPAAPAYHQQAHFGPPEPKAYPLSAGPKPSFIPAPLAADGTVVDTPEVAKLKADRIRELEEAEQRAAKYSNDEYAREGQYQPQGAQYQPQPAQYQPQPAIPRTAYPGAPAPGYPGAPAPAAAYPAPQSYPGAGRAYQPAPAAYQPQPQAYPGAPQSYQHQY